MYDFIAGRVAQRSGTSVVVDANGVGYELLAPLGSSFPPVGSEARVWAHLAVREDAQTLYGFLERADRDLFRILLRVRGVGPGMALAILSGLSPDELVQAVMHEDLKALTRIKGVGKKTGEQILLDLRDKGPQLAGAATPGSAPSSPDRPAPPVVPPAVTDAITALVSIGFSEKDATLAVEGAAEEHGTEDLEGLVRAAMRR